MRQGRDQPRNHLHLDHVQGEGDFAEPAKRLAVQRAGEDCLVSRRAEQDHGKQGDRQPLCKFKLTTVSAHAKIVAASAS